MPFREWFPPNHDLAPLARDVEALHASLKHLEHRIMSAIAEVSSPEVEWSDAIGAPTAASIVEMVAALQCDYDRLEELRDERDGHDDGPEAWASENPDDAAELAELESAAGDCENADDARERIMEDPLSVEVRSDWHAPGADDAGPAPGSGRATRACPAAYGPCAPRTPAQARAP